MNASIVKALGWAALALSALLTIGTVWVYGVIQQSLATFTASLSQTTVAAAEALAALAATTANRADCKPAWKYDQVSGVIGAQI